MCLDIDSAVAQRHPQHSRLLLSSGLAILNVCFSLLWLWVGCCAFNRLGRRGKTNTGHLLFYLWESFPESPTQQLLLIAYWLAVGHMIPTCPIPGWDRCAVDESWVSQPIVSAQTLCLSYWDICPSPQPVCADLLFQLSWMWSLSWPRSNLSLVSHRLVSFSDF